ncbi:MAG: transporter [Ferruginibacter sp.]
MIKNFKINPKSQADTNTGFGLNSSDYGGRFINKDGRPNIEKKGIGYFEKISWYHVFLDMSRLKFISTIVFFYIAINLLFALIYFLLGAEEFGVSSNSSNFKIFTEAFFFSSQAFTVGGYGRVDAGNLLINAFCAFESFLGLLSLAVVTGLLYGRFSRPKAYIKFSKNALVSPFRNGKALMLRFAPYKNTLLTDAQAKLSLGLVIEENGKKVNRFYDLELEYDLINSLTLSWTIVHPINESSPFYNFTQQDFKNTKGEVIVYVKAFDDMFSNTVISKTSYTFNEIIIGAKFLPMYYKSPHKNKTILRLDKLNLFEEISLESF